MVYQQLMFALSRLKRDGKEMIVRTKTIKPVHRFGLLSGGDKFWLDGELGTAASINDNGNAWFGSRKRYLHANCVVEPVDKHKAGRERVRWMRAAIKHVEAETGQRLSRADIVNAYRSTVNRTTWKAMFGQRQPIDLPESDPIFLAFRYLEVVAYIPARTADGFQDWNNGKWVICGDTGKFYL